MHSMEVGDADTRKFWKHYKYQERYSTCCCHALGAWLFRTAKTSIWIEYSLLYFGRKVGRGVVPSQHRHLSDRYPSITVSFDQQRLFLFYDSWPQNEEQRVYVDHDRVENCWILTVENYFFQRHYSSPSHLRPHCPLISDRFCYGRTKFVLQLLLVSDHLSNRDQRPLKCITCPSVSDQLMTS